MEKKPQSTDGIKFHYQVQMEVEMTIEEVEKLASHASTHYDSRCSSACRVGGFVYGWFNCVRFGVIPIKVSFDEADTACKILEGSGETELIAKWRGVIYQIKSEWCRINGVNHA